ncbi:MAG: indole-3-glycerol phosphate synthase TrpC [Lachnospiraceae bacterium]|nr:indole-3-glycerol phosphate synthase TrpC [Lachnospiraceae bacterium]
MSILDELAASAQRRVANDQKDLPEGLLRELVAEMGPGDGWRFQEALRKEGLSFLCEVKKASPSRGVIDPVFDHTGIARSYEEAGADAISCLTEPTRFLGSDRIFCEIRSCVRTPMLRKDFTVSTYQIRQARILGAQAVLLICALLSPAQLEQYLELCRECGLAALTETHDEAEIRMAVSAGAGIIGVNNRDLRTFSVDLSTAERLRGLVPADTLFVAESGVRSPQDAAYMRRIGADAVLVGEALMRSRDKRAFLDSLRTAAR